MKSTRKKSQKVDSLTSQAWVSAALDLLARHGIDGVRVEILAKTLRVTKGSFYWHFKNREALHVAMLDGWRKRATLGIIQRIEEGRGTARERFERLLHWPAQGQKAEHGAQIELSIRLWGRRDARAQAALDEVDDIRIRYISGLLKEGGVEPQAATERAIRAYSFMRVGPALAVVHQEHRWIDGCINSLWRP